MNFLTLFLSFILFFFFLLALKKNCISLYLWGEQHLQAHSFKETLLDISHQRVEHVVSRRWFACWWLTSNVSLHLVYDQQRQSLTACSAWPTVVHKKWGRNPHSCETWHFSNITSKTPIGKSTCQSNLFPHEIFLKVWQSGYFLLHKPTSPIHLRLQTHVKYGGSLWLKS